MKKRFYIVVSIFLAVVAITYNNCGRTDGVIFKVLGTETTNPMTVASVQILSSICTTITRCNQGLPMSQCSTGVEATLGIGPKLGLTSMTGPYSKIEFAEQAGTINSNLAATNNCAPIISNLDCSNPQVQGAYNPNSSNPFSGVPNMIPSGSGTCGNVYTNLLTLSPNYLTFLNLNTTIDFIASGGTPPYVFSLNGNGTIDSLSGSYSSASWPGTDAVVVTDSLGNSVQVSLVTGGNTLWAVGGENGGTYLNDILSDAGTAWSSMPSSIGPLADTAILPLNNALVLFGGSTSGTNDISGVYRSRDGFNWSLIGNFPGNAVRSGGATIYFNKKIWYLGGSANGTRASSVWNTADGSLWTDLGNALPQVMDHFGAVAFGGKMWIVGGSSGPNSWSGVYSSTDGMVWTQVGNLPIPLQSGAMVVYQNKMWWMGGVQMPGSVDHSEIYTSTDGTTWTLVGNLPEGPDSALSASIFNGKLFVVSGSAGTGSYSSADGLSWNSGPPLPTQRKFSTLVPFSPLK